MFKCGVWFVGFNLWLFGLIGLWFFLCYGIFCEREGENEGGNEDEEGWVVVLG